MPGPKPNTEIKLFLRKTFPAPIERVFEAWTRPDQITKWFAPPDTRTPFAEVDLRVGGKYRIGFEKEAAPGLRVVSGIYREVVHPSRLVFTWRWEDQPENTETLVTVELAQRGDNTELRLTHANFFDTDTMDHHNVGWIGCLDGLAHYL